MIPLNGSDISDHSLAFDRVPYDKDHSGVQPGGKLVLGGRPSDVAVTENQVTVPLISWTLGSHGAVIDEQAWSAPNAPVTFKWPGSDAVQQTPTLVNIDSGAPGVYLPTAVFNDYMSKVTSNACDGSGMPDLSVIFDGVEFAFDKRDLLVYNKGTDPAECYVNLADAGDSEGGL